MSDILGSDGAVRVTSTLEAVDQVAHEFVDRNIDILAICGGDGSDHCTLTAFHKVYAGRPLPLLLRSRRYDQLHRRCDGRPPRTPEQVLARVVRDYRRGHTHVTTERDVLRVTAGTAVELGFLLSFGTTVNFLRAYYAHDRQGPWPATKLLSKMMASGGVRDAHLASGVPGGRGGHRLRREPAAVPVVHVLLHGTVDQIALGFKPTYLALRKRGYFHVVGGPIAARRLVRRAARVYRGFPTESRTSTTTRGGGCPIRFKATDAHHVGWRHPRRV
jgi:hypothetical protein